MKQEGEHLHLDTPLAGQPGDRVSIATDAGVTLAGIWQGPHTVWVPGGFTVVHQGQAKPVQAVAVKLERDGLLPAPVVLYVPRSFFPGKEKAVLQVACYRPPHQLPGQVQWELYYDQPGILVAAGDDRAQPGTVYAEFPGWLPAGNYTLRAKLYDRAASLTGQDARHWWTPRPVNLLSSGDALHKHPPLFYRLFL